MGQNVVEHDECIFEIDVEADDAPVEWFHNGQLIEFNDPRFLIVTHGRKRRLVLRCAQLEDAGEVVVKTNSQSSSCQLSVICKQTF